MTDPATPPERPPSDPAAAPDPAVTPAEKPWTAETWTPEPWTPGTPPEPVATDTSAAVAPETPTSDPPAPEPRVQASAETPNPYGPPPAELPRAPTYNPSYQQQPYGAVYPQQTPYGGYGYTPPTPQELRQQRTGLAIGALVCSLIGIFTCGLASIAGLIMGHISYSQAKRGEGGGQSLALAAIIIGYVVLALWVGFIGFSALTGVFQPVNSH
jgi:Domain of unknown function (DUF4190)